FDRFQERRSVSASTQAPHPDWLRGDFRNLRSAGPNGRYGDSDDIGRVMFPVTTFNAHGVASTTKREFPTPNVIPLEMMSPAARKILPFIPAANVPGTLIGYVVNAVNDNRNPSLGQARDFYPNFGGRTESRNRLLASGFTRVITPGVINELRF